MRKIGEGCRCRRFISWILYVLDQMMGIYIFQQVAIFIIQAHLLFGVNSITKRAESEVNDSNAFLSQHRFGVVVNSNARPLCNIRIIESGQCTASC